VSQAQANAQLDRAKENDKAKAADRVAALAKALEAAKKELEHGTTDIIIEASFSEV
jgi:hypothetical protein